MSEENEEEQEEQEEKDAGSMIAQANKAADRLDQANERLEANLKRQENIAAESRLAGKTEAGTKQKVEEESATDYAKKVMANNV